MRPPVRATRSSAHMDASFSSNAACGVMPTLPTGMMRKTQTTAPAAGKRLRHRMTHTQLKRLDEAFRRSHYPSKDEKKRLAASLSMDFKTVTIWFQNKRQLSKKNAEPVMSTSTKNVRSLSVISSGGASESSSTGNKWRARLGSVSEHSALLDVDDRLSSKPRPMCSRFAPAVKPKDLPSSPFRHSTRPSLSLDSEYYDVEDLQRTKAWTLESVCAKQRDRVKRKGRGFEDLLVDSADAGADADMDTEEDDDEEDADVDGSDSDSPSILAYTYIPKIKVSSALYAQYHEDIIEGASLLLGLQSSQKIFVIQTRAIM